MKKRFAKTLKFILLSLGGIFILMISLSFTTLPFWGIYHLGVSQSSFDYKPDFIILLGGSGMPSKSALQRTYYTAQLSKIFPNAPIIIALPDLLKDSANNLEMMKMELQMRSVTADIIFEPEGTNTRAQALNIKHLLKDHLQNKLVIVSAPEHIYRSIKCFKKLGFQDVGGYPAFEKDLEHSLDFDSKKIGGRPFVPDIGQNSQLRYQFWNHLKYEITLLREYFAISYYKINGWI